MGRLDGIGGVLATFEAKFNKLVEILEENRKEKRSLPLPNSSPRLEARSIRCESVEFVEMEEETISENSQFRHMLPIDNEQDFDKLEYMLKEKNTFDAFVSLA